MARTSTKKSKEAVWVSCPIPGFTDERHLILPSTRELLNKVQDKSQAKEWENNQIVNKTDPNLFDQHYLDLIWQGWENVGIEHDDGRIEDPAAVNLPNKLILVNSRPIDFLLWLQRTSRDLAGHVQKETEAARETFRESSEAPPRLQEPEL